MTSLSLMEWNARSPLPCEWENIMTFNTTASEITKKLGSTEWEMHGDGGIDSGFLSSSGAGVSGGSTSDIGVVSLSKSSKSASTNSLSLGDVKVTGSTIEAFEGIPDSFSNKKETAKGCDASPILESSVGSSEPLLSLKLGKGTYFKDVCAGSNSKSSSYSLPAKKSKLNCPSTQAMTRCQVEGCNLDLSSSKDYHRKHRVCENHSKCPKVIVAGVERRFCQQCSRFHGLSEFDEKKRSCRRRLSDHNARRRKPQSEAFHFNAGRLPSASYDGKQQISFFWNRTPIVNARSGGNFLWESKVSSKSTPIKTQYPERLGNVNGQLNAAGNQLLNSISMHCQQSSGFVPFQAKCYATEVLHQEGSAISSNMDASQDLHRALSLLSTDSWNSCEPKHGSFNFSMPTYSTVNAAQPLTHAFPPSFPFAVSESWRTDNQPMGPHVPATVHGGGENRCQEFQLLRPPYGSDLYS